MLGGLSRSERSPAAWNPERRRPRRDSGGTRPRFRPQDSPPVRRQSAQGENGEAVPFGTKTVKRAVGFGCPRLQADGLPWSPFPPWIIPSGPSSASDPLPKVRRPARSSCHESTHPRPISHPGREAASEKVSGDARLVGRHPHQPIHDRRQGGWFGDLTERAQ